MSSLSFSRSFSNAKHGNRVLGNFRSGKTDPLQFIGGLKQSLLAYQSGSFAGSFAPLKHMVFIRENCLGNSRGNKRAVS